jgi:alpha-ribazole phosphatase
MEVYLIRHPVAQQEGGYCYGQTDLPVDIDLKAAAERIARRLPRKLNIIYSSPLSRSFNFARELNKFALGDSFPVQSAADLLELNFGHWEGKAWADIPKEEFTQWHEDFVRERPPGGETYEELYQRVDGFWSSLEAKATPNARIACVTHRGVILATLARTLEMPLANTFRFVTDPESITCIGRRSGQPSVEMVNN